MERVSLSSVLLAALFLWLIPAFCYWLLSSYYSTAGFISHANKITYAFDDALYFSIVTEAALGDDNLAAHGGARWLAAAQVVLAVVLTGLGIAKLTTLEARLSHRAVGDWIEVFRATDGTPIVTFSSIYQIGRTLRYDGANFAANGTSLGTFVGELIRESPMRATFNYSNRESNTELFVEGTTHHLFWSDTDSGDWNRFQSSCDDLEKGHVEIDGYRASDSEIRVIRGRDPVAQRKLIRQYIRNLPKVGEPGTPRPATPPSSPRPC